MSKNLKLTQVCFFSVKDRKYVDENGTEISNDLLVKHTHYIGEPFSYLVIK